MTRKQILARFMEKCPIAVMTRAAIENVLSDESLDDLFEQHAERQYTRALMFSTLVDVMIEVVCKARPSVNAAYQARKQALGVSVAALYDKLQKVEPRVMQAMVRETAIKMGQIVVHTGGAWPAWIRGYRTLIVDGNHLPASELRLKEVRDCNVAPLPGHALVVYDPMLGLVVDVLPCTDGHASERSLLPSLTAILRARDLILADRNFCTTEWLAEIVRELAFFLVRQHASSLRFELVGRRRKVGRVETGMVYEQQLRLLDAQGDQPIIRRITLVLDQPTTDGDVELHLLTNLPARIDALQIAPLYRHRWKIEGAFQEIEKALNSEIDTLAYPQAELFGLCVALVIYNVLSVVKAALRGAHGHEHVEKNVSNYYVSLELSGESPGMLVILPPEFWEQQFAALTPRAMARFLLRCARDADLGKYQKHPRGPKKKKPPSKQGRRHVSTQRLLDQRQANRKAALVLARK